jgi:hypothetical protein
MRSNRGEDDPQQGASGFDEDRPRTQDLLERLTAKLLRLDREAVRLAATMRQKAKPS